jgi:tetratricopeptide (TPR) repeat protein
LILQRLPKTELCVNEKSIEEQDMKRCIACLIILLSLFPIQGICETKEIIAEGEYVMGAGETMAIAEERAMKKAAQNAAEEAGAFVKSYSKVQNLTLAEDVVEVVANHAMKITVLDRKKSVIGDLDAIKFQVKIKAVMTTEEVAANLKKVREDRGVVDAYNRLKADYDRQAREMETLKKRLTETGGEEKKQILAEITNEEKRFKANLWLEKATDLGGGEMAMKAYDKAIELNPALVEAYIRRANLVKSFSVEDCDMLLSKGPSDCTIQQENLNKALSDLNKAISLDKGHAEAYVVKADVYSRLKNVQWRVAYSRQESVEALSEINKKYAAHIFETINHAISLKPENPEYYAKRSHYYGEDDDKAISDISRAIVLCRETDCSSLAYYYEKRADLYRNAGKMELWVKDEVEAKKIYAGKEKEVKNAGDAMQKSEMDEMIKRIYPGSKLVDEKEKEQTLKGLNIKISQKKGTAEDFILRADLDDRQENKLSDYSEGIRLLKSGRPEGENALLLIRVYLFKAAAFEKQHDSALQELKEAKVVLDQHLPRAKDLLKDDDYQAIQGGAEEKLLKLTRSEAEGCLWRMLAGKIVNARAAIYEELGLPGKATVEYQYLCEKLKDAQACKDMERLK